MKNGAMSDLNLDPFFQDLSWLLPPLQLALLNFCLLPLHGYILHGYRMVRPGKRQLTHPKTSDALVMHPSLMHSRIDAIGRKKSELYDVVLGYSSFC